MDSEQLPIHPLSHYYLYAKGHYETLTIDGTLWGDLKRIHEEYCGLDDQYINHSDILNILLIEVEKQMKHASYPTFVDFISGISPENTWKYWNYEKDFKYDFHFAVVVKCLSILRWVTVLDRDHNPILNLGEPDPLLLPLNSKGCLF